MNIFTKLFLLLAGLVIVPLAAITAVLVHNAGSLKDKLTDQVQFTGDAVAKKSERALLKQVELTHLKIIQEKAGRLEAFFESIRSAVVLEATLIRQHLASDAPAAPPFPLYSADEVNHLRETDPDWKRDVYQKKPYAMHQRVAGVERERVELPLLQLTQLGGFFNHAFTFIPGCASAYLGHRDGLTFGYPGGSRFSAEYDPRQRPWYLQASETGATIWTDPYYDRGDNGLVVTCASPVYLPDGTLIAVAAMDVRLKELLHELFALGDLQVSEAMLIDEADRIRVRGRYMDEHGTLPETMAEPQHVGASDDAALRQAFARIDAAGGSSGMIMGPADAGDASLYIHAPVRFRTGDSASDSPSVASRGAGAVIWRYVVKVPLEPVVRPAQEIRDDIGATTQQMRATMEGDVVSLTAIVATIAALAMVFALGLAFFFAGSATRPLVQMQTIAGRIATGDFNQQVAVRSKDEIGRLGNAINQMIVGLKEREFVKRTFKRYLAASIVDELIKDPSKVRVGGERRELTVFFSDLSGFTSLTERMDAATLLGQLNEYLSVMTDSIIAHEGTFDKYLGDGILAFWGAPVTRPNDALQACRAAIANVNALAQLWPSWERRGLPRLNMRIGLQTGPVVVGNIGSDTTQLDYTVIGDTANTAARLESVNKVYGTSILMGQATRRAAGDQIIAREIDRIALKGRQESVTICELVGLRDQAKPALLEACRVFESALGSYRLQRWDEAEAGFTEVISLLGDDPPSRVFLQRIAAFRAQPPRDDWDGSFVMTEK
jgi:class 3 adenylate cyclase/HAMP domain-containing protein